MFSTADAAEAEQELPNTTSAPKRETDDFTIPVGAPGSFKGLIATKLGITYPGPAALDKDGLVTPAFVEMQGTDYAKLIATKVKQLDEMKEKEAGPEEIEMVKEELRKLFDSLSTKEKWDPKIFEYLRPIDEECLSKIGAQSDMETYKANALISGESLIAAIDAVAFKGFVGHRDDLKVGRGLMLLTSLGDKHRIHFYHADHESAFDAVMRYQMIKDVAGAKCFEKGQINTAKKATEKINAEHTLSGTFRAMYVENNLLHIHSEVEEVSKYASSTIATSWGMEEIPACCCEYQIPKCPACPACPGCPGCKCSCTWCCWKLFSCMTDCCKAMPFMATGSDGMWSGSTKTEMDKKAALDLLLVKPWETSENGVDVMLPLEAMEREGSVPGGVTEKAGKTRSAHTIHLTMRNSATNKIEDGMVIVDPATPMAEIIKFVSTIQTCTENGSIDMKDSMITWTSMGLKKEGLLPSMPATNSASMDSFAGGFGGFAFGQK